MVLLGSGVYFYHQWDVYVDIQDTLGHVNLNMRYGQDLLSSKTYCLWFNGFNSLPSPISFSCSLSPPPQPPSHSPSHPSPLHLWFVFLACWVHGHKKLPVPTSLATRHGHMTKMCSRQWKQMDIHVGSSTTSFKVWSSWTLHPLLWFFPAIIFWPGRQMLLSQTIRLRQLKEDGVVSWLCSRRNQPYGTVNSTCGKCGLIMCKAIYRCPGTYLWPSGVSQLFIYNPFLFNLQSYTYFFCAVCMQVMSFQDLVLYQWTISYLSGPAVNPVVRKKRQILPFV